MTGKSSRNTFVWLLAAMLPGSDPARAHHSASACDEAATASETGVVTRLQWRNPHVIIRLDVVGKDGKWTATRWRSSFA